LAPALLGPAAGRLALATWGGARSALVALAALEAAAAPAAEAAEADLAVLRSGCFFSGSLFFVLIAAGALVT